MIDKNGVVEYKNIPDDKLSRIALVSIMFANNETGVILPINDIFSKFDGEKNLIQVLDYFKTKLNGNRPSFQPIFHTDASQIIGRVVLPTPFAFDVMTVTGHKFGGPCSGVLIATNDDMVKALKHYPLLFGGGQEFGIRSGFVLF